MFERYTEKARRIIFFGRYEASQFGSPYIETEHLLLGLLREDKALANRFLRSHAAVESIRKQIERHTAPGESVSTSVDLPLSHECKRVLAYGAEEAERLNHEYIGTAHLLLGLLREEKCFAAQLLREQGLTLASVREQVQQSEPSFAQGGSALFARLDQWLAEREARTQTLRSEFCSPAAAPALFGLLHASSVPASGKLRIFCNIGGHSTGPFQQDSSKLAAAPVTPRAIRSTTSSMARVTSGEGQLPCSNRLPSMP